MSPTEKKMEKARRRRAVRRQSGKASSPSSASSSSLFSSSPKLLSHASVSSSSLSIVSSSSPSPQSDQASSLLDAVGPSTQNSTSGSATARRRRKKRPASRGSSIIVDEKPSPASLSESLPTPPSAQPVSPSTVSSNEDRKPDLGDIEMSETVVRDSFPSASSSVSSARTKTKTTTKRQRDSQPVLPQAPLPSVSAAPRSAPIVSSSSTASSPTSATTSTTSKTSRSTSSTSRITPRAATWTTSLSTASTSASATSSRPSFRRLAITPDRFYGRAVPALQVRSIVPHPPLHLAVPVAPVRPTVPAAPVRAAVSDTPFRRIVPAGPVRSCISATPIQPPKSAAPVPPTAPTAPVRLAVPTTSASAVPAVVPACVIGPVTAIGVTENAAPARFATPTSTASATPATAAPVSAPDASMRTTIPPAPEPVAASATPVHTAISAPSASVADKVGQVPVAATTPAIAAATTSVTPVCGAVPATPGRKSALAVPVPIAVSTAPVQATVIAQSVTNTPAATEPANVPAAPVSAAAPAAPVRRGPTWAVAPREVSPPRSTAASTGGSSSSLPSTSTLPKKASAPKKKATPKKTPAPKKAAASKKATTEKAATTPKEATVTKKTELSEKAAGKKKATAPKAVGAKKAAPKAASVGVNTSVSPAHASTSQLPILQAVAGPSSASSSSGGSSSGGPCSGGSCSTGLSSSSSVYTMAHTVTVPHSQHPIQTVAFPIPHIGPRPLFPGVTVPPSSSSLRTAHQVEAVPPTPRYAQPYEQPSYTAAVPSRSYSQHYAPQAMAERPRFNDQHPVLHIGGEHPRFYSAHPSRQVMAAPPMFHDPRLPPHASTMPATSDFHHPGAPHASSMPPPNYYHRPASYHRTMPPPSHSQPPNAYLIGAPPRWYHPHHHAPQTARMPPTPYLQHPNTPTTAMPAYHTPHSAPHSVATPPTNNLPHSASAPPSDPPLEAGPTPEARPPTPVPDSPRSRRRSFVELAGISPPPMEYIPTEEIFGDLASPEGGIDGLLTHLRPEPSRAVSPAVLIDSVSPESTPSVHHSNLGVPHVVHDSDSESDSDSDSIIYTGCGKVDNPSPLFLATADDYEFKLQIPFLDPWVPSEEDEDMDVDQHLLGPEEAELADDECSPGAVQLESATSSAAVTPAQLSSPGMEEESNNITSPVSAAGDVESFVGGAILPRTSSTSPSSQIADQLNEITLSPVSRDGGHYSTTSNDLEDEEEQPDIMSTDVVLDSMERATCPSDRLESVEYEPDWSEGENTAVALPSSEGETELDGYSHVSDSEYASSDCDAAEHDDPDAWEDALSSDSEATGSEAEDDGEHDDDNCSMCPEAHESDHEEDANVYVSSDIDMDELPPSQPPKPRRVYEPLPASRLLGPRPIKGFHLSSDGGFQALTERYDELCNLERAGIANLGVQMFMGSPRRMPTKAERYRLMNTVEASEFKHRLDVHRHTAQCTVHASHATNFAASNDEDRDLAFCSLHLEMSSCASLKIPTLCIHLGEDKKATTEELIERVAVRIEHLLASVEGVTLAIENMVRRSSQCGDTWSLSTIRKIIERVGSDRVKACVDICHAYISDYDMYDPQELDRFMGDLASLQGKIAGFHVSDSSTMHGNRCDGHANIGSGFIPLNVFRHILRQESWLGKIPYYLETPNYTSIRASAHKRMTTMEIRRRKLEWDFLDRVIRMPDDEWSDGRGEAEHAHYLEERKQPQNTFRNLVRGSRALQEKFSADRKKDARRRQHVAQQKRVRAGIEQARPILPRIPANEVAVWDGRRQASGKEKVKVVGKYSLRGKPKRVDTYADVASAEDVASFLQATNTGKQRRRGASEPQDVTTSRRSDRLR